ncbi:MAG: RagB/SusD family nutrient uptake outer membrane protein [Bacteroidota bacterium]
MKTRTLIITVLIITLVNQSCKKEFLDTKPSSSIVTPTTLAELQSLLDYTNYMNKTGALPQLSSDEYFIVSQSAYDAIITETAKNAYLWKKDIYGGETQIVDWNQLYRAVFYSNSVLDQVIKTQISSSMKTEWDNLKGSALFFRCFAYYDLARNFCPVYNSATAANDYGLPLKLKSGVDEVTQRASLKSTFEQILGDLNLSSMLLKDAAPTNSHNRPSQAAVYALLARIYLYMGDYENAAKSAEQCMGIYANLQDYNSISTTSATPFSYSSTETIFYSTQVIAYSNTSGYTTSNTSIGVDPELLALYATDDLRRLIFFGKNSLGNFNMKRGYLGGGNYAFTGLATDEILLIRAECAARKGDAATAVADLNLLLSKRFKTGKFTPLSASTPPEALTLVLTERRKELAWRALRWSDLKRLNRDGSNITIKRNLNGQEYTLAPNSPLYVFPIPNDEIQLSGISQNPR